jgi:acetyl esterase
VSTVLPLRARIEAGIARGLARLPPAVLRKMLGAPVVVDGQELALEEQLAIRLLDLSGASTVETMTVPEARAQIRSDAAAFAGRELAMERVDEVTLADSIPGRLYVPPRVDTPGPLLVYFHGGGFVVGDLDTHDNSCRFLARQAAVRVLAVDYRLAPEHTFPAAADDAVDAFRWVREHSSELEADRQRIAVGGDSAGGNLAAGVAQAIRGSVGPAFQLLFYPWLDLSAKRESYRLFGQGFYLTESQVDWYRAHYLASEHDALDPRCSPALTGDLSGVAPAYIATAGFDPLRDEGEEYATRLRAAGVRVALRRHADLIHAFFNAIGIGRVGREALLEASGALRVGLAGGGEPSGVMRAMLAGAEAEAS